MFYFLTVNQTVYYERGVGTADPTLNQHQISATICTFESSLYHATILFGGPVLWRRDLRGEYSAVDI